jgi:serralysin
MPLSDAQIIGALSHPHAWPGGVITFSLPDAVSAWAAYSASDEPFNADYAGLNTQQAGLFRQALDGWDRLIAPRIVEVSDAQPGDIRIAFTDVHDHRASSPDTAAYAYTGSGPGRPGDIWLDESVRASTFTPGGNDYWNMIHELGHALSLTHPFGTASALPAEYDNVRYTVMAYQPLPDGVWKVATRSGSSVRLDNEWVRPTTPMLFDVTALQAKYGADPTTDTGDTTYGWSESRPILATVYDAGGVDTFDLSQHTRGSAIDLTPGAFSSVAYWSGADQASYWTQALGVSSLSGWLQGQFSAGDTYTWSRNVATASNTTIENVIGGAGADTIGGNAAANQLSGRLGNDSIAGGDGQDYVRGDEGADTLVGGAAFDDLNGNMGADLVWGGTGDDWVVGGRDNDRLFGEQGLDIVYGNLGDDVCDGGEEADLVRGGQGNDVLYGVAGDDWLSGDRGDDTVTGGTGADIFHGSQDAGIDRVTDFSRAEGDRVQLDPGTTYTLRQAGADTVVDMGGGHQMVLVNVQLSSLTAGWIFGA